MSNILNQINLSQLSHSQITQNLIFTSLKPVIILNSINYKMQNSMPMRLSREHQINLMDI